MCNSFSLFVLLLASIVLCVSCQKDELVLVEPAPFETSIYPSCVNTFMVKSTVLDKTNLWYVRTQAVDDQTHYWLDTGAPAYDGVDVIVNATCDTVCWVGGFRIERACSLSYDPDGWVVEWEG